MNRRLAGVLRRRHRYSAAPVPGDLTTAHICCGLLHFNRTALMLGQGLESARVWWPPCRLVACMDPVNYKGHPIWGNDLCIMGRALGLTNYIFTLSAHKLLLLFVAPEGPIVCWLV